MKLLWQQTGIALRMLVLFSILTGLIYPLFITLAAQILFPWQANGSLIEMNGQTIGSVHIGQEFNTPIYFWGRPSKTPDFPYNAMNSQGSNLGPSNPERISLVKARIAQSQYVFQNNDPIPIDWVTASGSGLDPDISPPAAFYQVSRIAKARHIDAKDLQTFVQQHINPRTFGWLGEPRVNVLQLNLALDQKWPPS